MFKRSIKRLTAVAAFIVSLIAVLMSFSVAILQAESFDPTRATHLKSQSAPVLRPLNLNLRDYQVTSILLSEERKVAVTNNQVVTIGNTITAAGFGKATVTENKASEVTLTIPIPAGTPPGSKSTIKRFFIAGRITISRILAS